MTSEPAAGRAATRRCSTAAAAAYCAGQRPAGRRGGVLWASGVSDPVWRRRHRTHVRGTATPVAAARRPSLCRSGAALLICTRNPRAAPHHVIRTPRNAKHAATFRRSLCSLRAAATTLPPGHTGAPHRSLDSSPSSSWNTTFLSRSPSTCLMQSVYRALTELTFFECTCTSYRRARAG